MLILKLDYSPEPVRKSPKEIILIEFPKMIKEIPKFAIIKLTINANFLPKLSAKKVKKMNPETLPTNNGNL